MPYVLAADSKNPLTAITKALETELDKTKKSYSNFKESSKWDKNKDDYSDSDDDDTDESVTKDAYAPTGDVPAFPDDKKTYDPAEFWPPASPKPIVKYDFKTDDAASVYYAFTAKQTDSYGQTAFPPMTCQGERAAVGDGGGDV